jgi:glycosyltransferase involved in cell wall biosynthesis
MLMREAAPLRPEVEQGLRQQRGVDVALHRVIGQTLPDDRCRWDAIARGRNEGKARGAAPWLMFLDDDVALEPGCISTLVAELSRRPHYAALAADYLGERRDGQVSRHVAMGATLFRREALEHVRFRWLRDRCECQCCCDDLRRGRWAIDYSPNVRARHLPREPAGDDAAPPDHRTPPDLQTSTLGAEQPDRPPTVCLVAAYLGPPPGWIRLYLQSCAHNPSIDFLILTDQDNFPPAPPNVRVRRLSASSFDKLASDKIGFDVRLSHSRKLCDFKPAYGHLFEELLEGWDYWGYTDLDVVYGDLRRHLTDACWHDYDLFTARKEFLVGHFTLLRNNDRMNRLYQESRDLRATLQSPRVESFDECGGQWHRLARGEPLSDDASCDSMTHVVQRLTANNEVSALFCPAAIEWPELTEPRWRLRWQSGRLWYVNQGREVMYYHFHAFKGRPGYRKPRRVAPGAAFDMTAHGMGPAFTTLEPAWA